VLPGQEAERAYALCRARARVDALVAVAGEAPPAAEVVTVRDPVVAATVQELKAGLFEELVDMLGRGGQVGLFLLSS
jgi:hypothetical protein